MKLKKIILVFSITSKGLLSLENPYLEEIPEILIMENEYLSQFPRSFYVFELDPKDFVICKINPKYPELEIIPKTFIIDNIEYPHIGEFNNRVLNDFFNTQNLSSGIDLLVKGYKKDPLFFSFLYNLGRLYQIQNNYSVSNFYFHKVLYYFPEYPRIHFHLGKNYFLLNDEIRGEYHFRKAINLERNNIEYLIEFIEILLQKNQISKAKIYIQYGEKNFSENPYFQLSKAHYYIQMRQTSNAIKILESLPLNQFSEFTGLEIKLKKSQLYEELNLFDKSIKELEDLIQTKNKEFRNKYTKEFLEEQKKRLEKFMSSP